MNTITKEQERAELAGVIILVQGEHIVNRIISSGKIDDEDLNCLLPYYEAKEQMPQGADPEAWIVKRILELRESVSITRI